MERFDYTVESSKGFDEAVSAVEAKTKEKGFKVMTVHDVKATLGSAGFSIEPMKIVEICNAKYANQVLAKDINISLMLPCRVVVSVRGGKTVIGTFRPIILANFFPVPGLADIAAEVDGIMAAIIDGAR